MTKVPATEFKAKCLELMDRVAEHRETYVITKHGKPVAKLVPVEPRPRETLFGCLRDKVDVIGDIMAPAVPIRAWETLKKWDERNAPDPPRRKRRRQR
jgi:prevent-host-death family protein